MWAIIYYRSAQRIVLYKFFEEVSRGRQRNKNYKSYSIDGSVYYIAREQYTRVLLERSTREYCMPPSPVIHIASIALV